MNGESQSAELKLCPECRKMERISHIRRQDMFCASCRKWLRKLVVSVDSKGSRWTGAGEHFELLGDRPWMVSGHEVNENRMVRLFNDGQFEIELGNVVPHVGNGLQAKILGSVPGVVEPRRPLALTVELTGSCSDIESKLEIICHGSFPGGRLEKTIPVVAAPDRFVASPIANPFDHRGYDPWSAHAHAKHAQEDVHSRPPTRDQEDGQFGWTCSPLHLAIGPGVDRFRFVVTPDWDSLEENVGACLNGCEADSWKFELDGDPAGDVVFVGGEHGILFPFVFELTGFAKSIRETHDELEGRFSFRLATLGSPTVDVPIVFHPERPEWKPTLPAARGANQDQELRTTIPAGFRSAVTLDFVIEDDDDLRNLASFKRLCGHRLRIDDENGDMKFESEKPVWHKIERLSPCFPEGKYMDPQFRKLIRYQVIIMPKEGDQVASSEATLSLILEGRIGDEWLPMTGRSPFRLKVRVVAPGANQPRGVAAPIHLVADMGTTSTCVVKYSPERPPEFVPLTLDCGPSLAGEKTIETQVWKPGEQEDGAEPESIIGKWITWRRKDNGVDGGRAWERFKPDLGVSADRIDELYGDNRPELLAADFLERLLLHVREFDLQNEVVSDFHVTCPATFTHDQRELLRNILCNIKRSGVSGMTDICLDEASAGAICDIFELFPRAMPKHSPKYLVFDFGGGTVDISLIEAIHESQDGDDRRKYRLRPLGITGLADFGGRNVTDIIRRLLKERLWEGLMRGFDGENPMQVGEGFWIPLQGVGQDLRANGNTTARRLAAQNDRWFWELAEQIKLTIYSPSNRSSNADFDASENVIDIGKLRVDLAGNVQALQQSRGSSAELRSVDAGNVERWLGKVVVTRGDIDEKLRPVINEVFERAIGLWNHANKYESKTIEAAPPDGLLLAGKCSQLPMLRQMIDEWDHWNGKLDLPGDRLGGENPQESLKVKVAQGGALYKNREHIKQAKLQIAVENAADYVLLPLMQKVDVGGSGRGIFEFLFQTQLCRLDERSPADAAWQSWEDGGTVRIEYFESADYRLEGVTISPELKYAGIRTLGQSYLGMLELELPAASEDRVLHYVVRVGKEGEGRYLVVECGGGDEKVELGRLPI